MKVPEKNIAKFDHHGSNKNYFAIGVPQFERKTGVKPIELAELSSYYSVTQSYVNSFRGDVVLDSLHNVSMY